MAKRRPFQQVLTRTVVPCLEEFVDCFVRPSRPLLVRGAFNERWTSRWTVDVLRQRLLLNTKAKQHQQQQEQAEGGGGTIMATKQEDNDDGGRLLIPSPAGSNFVARCSPNSRRTVVVDDEQLCHDNNNKDQLLIPSPGNNYVSQYKSQEVELPTKQALDEFIKLSRQDGRGCQCRLDPSVFWEPIDELPPLLSDDQFEIIYDNSFVWITSKSLRTSLHPDPDEGILAHLVGKKRAVLISPFNKSEQDLDRLFEYRWTNGSIADLYLNDAQSSDNNNFAATLDNKYLVELNPGDMLYIPKSWLHDIESTTETVSLVTRFEITM